MFFFIEARKLRFGSCLPLLVVVVVMRKKNIPNLQFVTTASRDDIPAWEQAEQACQGGARWISLRTNYNSYKELLPIAEKTQYVCKKYKAKFIVNSNIILAKYLKSDGIHLNPKDSPVDQARLFLGKDVIIGKSTNNFDETRLAYGMGADYVALGPTRFNHNQGLTKPLVTVSQFVEIKKRCQFEMIDIPIIARGGLNPEDFELFMELGLDGVAITYNPETPISIKDRTESLLEKLSHFN